MISDFIFHGHLHGTCRGKAPPSCLRKTALPLKSPTGAFIASQTLIFRRKQIIRTYLLSETSSDYFCLVRLSGKRFEPSILKKRKILIPTWVYSCCVRHEENRSENCRIVFPQMGVSRMGYGHCNIIYGQIRQKSLIFFCLSVIPFVIRPMALLSSPMVETPALKETFRKNTTR